MFVILGGGAAVSIQLISLISDQNGARGNRELKPTMIEEMNNKEGR